MTNITKPIGERNRLVSKEEAKAMLERVVVREEKVVTKVSKKRKKQEKKVDEEKTILFHGKQLVKHEYDVLEEMARELFDIGAKEYFKEVNSPSSYVYLCIRHNHVEELNMAYQDLDKIPRQINELKKLKKINLRNNIIQDIENVDNLTELRILLLYTNNIYEIKNLDNNKKLKKIGLEWNYNLDLDTPHNNREYRKLLDRRVCVIK